MLSYIFVILGFLVGFLVGLTGIGGGALMTPSLIFLGVEPLTAVGTDLLYAFITKVFGFLLHKKNGNINFNISLKLFLGSLPAIILGSFILEITNKNVLNKYVTLILAFVLIISSIISLNKNRFKNKKHLSTNTLLLIGFLVGLIVQFTSVGSGVIVGFVLLNFTNLHPKDVVGTTIFYGVLIALFGCLSYATFGDINYLLSLYLIFGTILGVYLGTHLNSKTPKEVLRRTMIILILIIGVIILIKAFMEF